MTLIKFRQMNPASFSALLRKVATLLLLLANISGLPLMADAREHRVSNLTAETQSNSGILTIKATNIRKAKGNVRFVLYRNQMEFDNDQRFQQLSAEISNKESVARFENIPPGLYAVAVFHDENKNGELDDNWIGMPKEGYGVSNNIRKGFMKIPTFEEMKVSYSGGELYLQIRIQY